jgi:hypothetical protein
VRGVDRDGDGYGVYVAFQGVKDCEFMVGGFPKNLRENHESLDNPGNASIILDMSQSFAVSSRYLVCITA